MTSAELRAAGQLGGHALAGMVSRVEQVHRAVAGRAVGPLHEAAEPARIIHDAVARGVYATVRGASSAAGSMSGRVASRFGTGNRAAGGNLALAMLAAVNAVAGDRLGPDLAPLAIKMAVRAGEQDVDLVTEELAAAFPQPTARLAVFVHGLSETDRSWHRKAAAHLPYGPRLHADFGYTPVYLRYCTGRHVSDNGRNLADLLDRLLASWPVQVRDVVLVGHSMGGLVIRSACHHGTQASALWAQRLRQVFYLGSPHMGAPLAGAAGLAGLAPGKTPETRPFVTLVNGSSSGIKDLRYGYLPSVDWDGCDQDSCLLDHRSDVPLLSEAGHFAVSATVTADPASPVGAVAGDLLVQPASAQGSRRGRQHIPFPGRRGLGGMHHFDLLNHPAVWAAMRDILDRAGRWPGPAASTGS
jgi:pimeloyl-ACP methyl ester carboxylesterase